MSISTDIISLKRINERRKYVENYVKNNPSCNIFEAIDKLDVNKIDELINKYDIKIERKFASCILSHLLVIEKFLKSDNKYQIVIEDDFEIKKKLPESIEEIENIIKEIGINKKYLDILYLSERIDKNHKYEITGGCGTEGYILTRKGAVKLKYILEKNVQYPLDLQIQAHFKHCHYIRNLINDRVKYICVNAYGSKDTYVICRGLESTIN